MKGLALLTVVVLAAIGIGVAFVPTEPTQQGNEIIAERLASRLLAEAPLPRAALPASAVLANRPLLGSPHPAIPGALVVRRVFLAPGDEDAVFDLITAHTPPGLRNDVRGSGYAPATGYVEDLVDEVTNAVPPIIAAQLGYAIAAHGANEVLVVVDAFVAWNPDRPPTEVVPADSTILDVSLSVRSIAAGGGTPVLAKAVTDAATIGHIRTIVNNLPVGRSIVTLGVNCDEFETWRLSFAHHSGRAPTFVLTESSCGPMSDLWRVSVGGHGSAPLSDWNSELIDAIAPLFGSARTSGELESGTGALVAPLAGVLTFRNSDGMTRSARVGPDGQFSVLLPYGDYTVSAVPAGRDRPCTLLGEEVSVDPIAPSAAGQAFQCVGVPSVVPSPATADAWYDNVGRALLRHLVADAQGVVHVEQSPRGAGVGPATSSAALLTTVRLAGTPAAREAANSLTPALFQRWQGITASAGALASSCNTLQPASLLRNAEELEVQLRIFSLGFPAS